MRNANVSLSESDLHELTLRRDNDRLPYCPSPSFISIRTPTTPKASNMATSVDAKLLRTTKFPPEFNQKVDMKKVNLEVMKKYVSGMREPVSTLIC